MGRIRTIKPDFFKHGDLYDAERKENLPLRLAFAGLWCLCDREGRFRWKPREMKLDVLPWDECSFEAVLDALAEHGFVIAYERDGEKFGVVPSFSKHQSINIRESQSVLPDPEDSQSTHVQARARHHAVNINPKLAAEVMAADGGKCGRCSSTADLTIDHIFPQSMGGTHARGNLRTLCRSCNSARPVAGQGLIEDLAKDGLSMQDMERTCAHVQGKGEGKGREGKGSRAATEKVIIPVWLPSEDWMAFVEHRKQIKKPMTGRAEYLNLLELIKHYDAGEDALHVLRNTIARGWQGFVWENAPKRKQEYRPATAEDDLWAEIGAVSV